MTDPVPLKLIWRNDSTTVNIVRGFFFQRGQLSDAQQLD
jgi:hypothetical protein